MQALTVQITNAVLVSSKFNFYTTAWQVGAKKAFCLNNMKIRFWLVQKVRKTLSWIELGYRRSTRINETEIEHWSWQLKWLEKCRKMMLLLFVFFAVKFHSRSSAWKNVYSKINKMIGRKCFPLLIISLCIYTNSPEVLFHPTYISGIINRPLAEAYHMTTDAFTAVKCSSIAKRRN